MMTGIMILGLFISAQDQSFYAGDYPDPEITYDELDAMMLRYPPRELGGHKLGHGRSAPERRDIAKALNDRIRWDGPVNPDLGAFYQKRMQRALDEIENTPAPKKGIVVWKMYSSGVIVKSREGVFAFDVVEGCVPPGLTPAEAFNQLPAPAHLAEVFPYRLHWTPAMRDQFARLVDVYFSTHYHYDHLSAILVDALLQAGKTVVATEQARKTCMEWGIQGADRIVTMPQDQLSYLTSKEYEVSGVTAITFNGYQDEYRKTEQDGRWVWTLNTDPRRAENNVYVVRIGGVNVFHNGDVHHCPGLYPWLVNLVDTEWAPDPCLTVPWFENWHRAIPKLFPDAAMTVVHELELGHTSFREGEPDPRPIFRVGKADAQYLMWGETIRIPEPRR
ncbi:MAG: MBL fold metallo-hydrolase [bacterium]|nr:MBL fold metallo-hydrolase [bacterium]